MDQDSSYSGLCVLEHLPSVFVFGLFGGHTQQLWSVVDVNLRIGPFTSSVQCTLSGLPLILYFCFSNAWQYSEITPDFMFKDHFEWNLSYDMGVSAACMANALSTVLPLWPLQTDINLVPRQISKHMHVL